MADSPMYNAPVGAQEKPILEKLVLLRDKLFLLKQDKSTHVKSQDVLPLYEDIIELVHQLNDVRGSDHLVQNRVDAVLDDCLQLISLFFMAVGRNTEAPALYSMTSNITRLCNHLKEAAFYQARDLDSIGETLDKMKHTLQKEPEKYSPYLMIRVQHRIEVCEKLLQELRDYLSNISPAMLPKWESLVSILRALAALNTRSKYNQKDLDDLKKQLYDLKADLASTLDTNGNGEISGGRERVQPLLERCLLFCDLIQERYVAT